MRFMENINKLQAVLTELRREVQRSEAPKVGKLPCRHTLWTCPICHAKEYAKYMVAGCICYPKIPGSYKNCPVHGKDTWAGGSRPTDRPTKEHILTPDLPLNVRVAKALGLNPFFDYVGWCSIEKARKENLGAWCYATENHRSNLVPDYPNDLVAAMGALEEYQEKHELVGEAIIDGFGGWFFRLTDDFAKLYTTGGYSAKTFPQAICEAIVAHAEGK